MTLFSLILVLNPSAVEVAQASPFSIADQGVAMSLSFDGANYLVGVENHQTTPSTIGAQLISAEGAKVGPLVSTGRSGIATALAFDGVNHLIIWEDDELGTLNGNTGWKVYGQFVSQQGSAVGIPFALTTAGIWFDGIKTLAFGAGRYLVTYTRLIVPANGDHSNNRYIAGRILQPDGTLGNEFRISTGHGKASDVAFDGVNFLVVWCEDLDDREIRGRFVSLDGVLGAEMLINDGQAPTDNPKSVVFGGANYLVVWNEEVGGAETGTWDCFGQLVSPTGSRVGGRIPLTVEPGPQLVTTASFDGVNFLAVWVDMREEANWDLYGQFVGVDGSLVGGNLTISTNAGNQLGGTGSAGSRHLVLVNNGVEFGPGGISQVESAEGLFVARLASPAVEVGGADFGVRSDLFGFAITGVSGQRVVVEVSSDLAIPNWAPVQTNRITDGSVYFSDPQWTSHPGRFYRLRSP